MGNLIDREAAYNVLTEYYRQRLTIQHEALKEALSLVPTVEAEPVVHSWWIPHPGYRDWDICYACGTGTKRREYGPVENNREWVTEYGYKYCPHCGARMDGKDRDNE
ncbi:MAG: hypothetical protein J6S14_12365 [Clostridia bacterium]|nr:hypothetical protein [Clostridia bacterium]